MYTLGGVHDVERGWGRTGETWRIQDELRAYGAQPDWFGLGDLDIGTHLVRTRMLDAGYPAIRRHGPRCASVGTSACAMLPDDRRALRDPRGGRSARGAPRDPLPGMVGALPRGPARARVRAGRRRRRQAGARACWTRSPRPTSCCSRRAIRWSRSARSSAWRASTRRSPTARHPSSGVSPIIGGAPVRGMADACLPAIGVADQRRGRRPPLRRAQRGRRARRLVDPRGRHRRGPRRRGAGGAAADDRRRRDRRDGPRCAWSSCVDRRRPRPSAGDHRRTRASASCGPVTISRPRSPTQHRARRRRRRGRHLEGHLENRKPADTCSTATIPSSARRRGARPSTPRRCG